MQQFLTDQPRALIELPRDHGKTTQICGRILWELGHNPELRVAIVCASEALAQERGVFLRRLIEQNARVRDVFPNLKPGKRWSIDTFDLSGERQQLGGSVRLAGVHTLLTGFRADLLVCDDIVDARCLYSASERQRVEGYFHENLLNLLEPTGRLWNLFTPWHREDVNARLKKNPVFAHFRAGIDSELNPIWPEHWSRQRLLQRRAEIGATAFARAYQLQPLAEGDTLIPRSTILYFQEAQTYRQILLSIDPAISTLPGADRTACVLLGQTESGTIDCLAALARRLRPLQLRELLVNWPIDPQPQTILIEQNGGFQALVEVLKEEPRLQHRIKTITQTRNKASRIQTLAVLLEQGLVRLRGDNGCVEPAQQELYDELTQFPLGQHDDLADALASGCIWLRATPEPRIW